ncbi:MAG: SBBP repeat-containing protein, partial [Dehalococcoidia bacterium]
MFVIACGGCETGPTSTPTPTPTKVLTPTIPPTVPPGFTDLPVGWVRQFGSGATDMATDVAVDREGNVYVAGITAGVLPDQTSAGSRDALVRKYAPDGQEMWTVQFGSP